jgi:predicted dehydrogenase
MREAADPVISKYLAAQPAENFGIAGVRVTRIWCDEAQDAHRIAAASRIPNPVQRPEGLIGNVDAVLIPTDVGGEHLRSAAPFVVAGIPVFVDKPLCDNPQDLRTFVDWVASGRAILSCSAFRFAPEFKQLRENRETRDDLGPLRLITMTMAKSWRRYGMHALEGVYPFLEPDGWLSVANTGRDGADVVHLRHGGGVDVVIAVIDDLFGGFGHLTLYGTRDKRCAQFADSFTAFKTQLAAFVSYLRSGDPPFPFEQTVELVKLLVAAEKSKDRGGRTVELSEIAA